MEVKFLTDYSRFAKMKESENGSIWKINEVLQNIRKPSCALI